MATRRSDYDVYLITADDGPVGEERRDALLDVTAMSLEEFRAHAMPGSGTEWNRYSFAHARILKDRPDGLIGELVSAKATLSAPEARQTAAAALDSFVNAVYRWLKNHRDGHAAEARLDAAESIPPLLTFLFALDHRVRPYNRYLAWELRNHPSDRLRGGMSGCCRFWRASCRTPLRTSLGGSSRRWSRSHVPPVTARHWRRGATTSVSCGEIPPTTAPAILSSDARRRAAGRGLPRLHRSSPRDRPSTTRKQARPVISPMHSRP
nr:hypothetical protein GCM10020093_024390 [Planobispora longispora]